MHEQNANQRSLYKRNRGGHRARFARSCRPRKLSLQVPHDGMQVSRQTSMRGDRFRQCPLPPSPLPPPPRRWDLCPIPKISDIFQRTFVGLFYGDRLHEDESEFPSPLHRGMTNSFGQWPVSRPARHVGPPRTTPSMGS